MAKLRPLDRPAVPAEVLLQRWPRLPHVDPAGLPLHTSNPDNVTSSSVLPTR